MWMHVIFGYETKWEIVKSYTLRFAAAYWRFVPLGESPYSPLYEDILKLSGMGDIILLVGSMHKLRMNK
jgi:hypothetical protein